MKSSTLEKRRLRNSLLRMSCFSGFEAPVRHVFELFEGRTEQFQKCEYLSLKCFLSFKTVDDLWYISHPNPGACVPWELDEFVAQNPQEFIRCFEYKVVFAIMFNRICPEPILNRTNLQNEDLLSASCSSPKTPVNANMSSFTFASHVWGGDDKSC